MIDLRITLLLSLFVIGFGFSHAKEQPNFIIIFTDDQGYQDLGCFGSPKIKTPEIDKMAKDGVRFSSFYSANAICSASRAALLTGRYPSRNGVFHVYYPGASKGLSPSEITIAEVMKTAGYRTSIIGKWHLGDRPQFLPTNQGFDSYFGIPYSNDMWIHKDQELAKDVKLYDGATVKSIQSGDEEKRKDKSGRVPLMRNDKIIEYPVDQTYLTERYTDEALRIIKESEKKKQPYFIFLTYAMPHIPLYASPKFKGKSERGPYGDTIEEMDYHVGRILKHLKSSGTDKNTLVVFTSDNGPWKLSGNRGGSAAPLRGAKFSTHEGGHRVPCVMWWPGTIPAGTDSSEISSTLDFMPTLASLAGADLPEHRILDGKNITRMLQDGPKGKSEYSKFFYWNKDHIEAVRMGNMKLRQQWDNKTKSRGKPELYNLAEDISESNNLASQMPEKLKAMTRILYKEEHDQLLHSAFMVEVPKPVYNSNSVLVQASGHSNKNVPINAFDGNPKTRWTAKGGSFPQWIQACYQEDQQSSAIKITWAKEAAHRYVIGTSMDGESWEVDIDQMNNYNSSEVTKDSLPDKKFRYLRIAIIGADKSGWASIKEINF
jgi:arylsulfatase A-like enzyme